MKKLVAAAGLAVSALVVSAPAFALGDLRDALKEAREAREERPRVAAPEIDVTAGTKGIAALIAGLLLAAEALRRRR
jgi:hypothetical protein